jgi:4-amino-4-deoxy-L-arabinose transferase-like glycosyltransferase
MACKIRVVVADRGVKTGMRYMKWVLWGLCLLVLFYGLGRAQLFEPDEGRNAEIAREILVTGDWVTPHNDFLPVLDKPIPFFWLVAIAYKLFGVSEGPARLPSALAALGCLVLVFRFCRSSFGVSQALWSLLVLTTSAEFFVLSRVVIFDMTLTFCISLALCSFYASTQTDNERSRKRACVLMYAALGAGVLIKGPVGLLVPMMVIGSYLLLTKKLAFVSRMLPFAGLMIVLAIVGPWYGWAESRNPGYLKYFLWEEQFLRFLTAHFNRGEPWYYFFLVLAAGFFPWTLALPVVVKELWKERSDDRNVFLIGWIVVPFVFFSCSSAKLPHYILPIFPPLAILTGRCLQRHCNGAISKSNALLALPWLVEILMFLYVFLGTFWPAVLPAPLRPAVYEVKRTLWLFGFLILATFPLALAVGRRDVKDPTGAGRLGFGFLGMVLVLLAVVHITAAVSRFRSAKGLAENSLRFVTSTEQLVLYDTYLSGLLFYLKVARPIWIVSSGTKSNIMGSWYASEKQPPSPKGKVLFTFKEFDEAWRASKQRFLVYVKDKNFSRLKGSAKAPPIELSTIDGFVLATNR